MEKKIGKLWFEEQELDSRQGQTIIFYSNQASFLDLPASSPLVVGDAFPGVK